MEYVAGFMFNPDGGSVVLVEKQKPAFQKGKYNGVGGKIEPMETSMQAMIREFEEETGVYHINWEHFASVNNPNGLWKVDFYKTFTDDAYKAKTVEMEEIRLIPVSVMKSFPLMPNLSFLIELARAANSIILPVTFLDNSFGDAKYDRK